MERQTAKVYSVGHMERYMMGNGRMESKKDMEFGGVLKMILTLVNGRIARLMDTGFILGKEEIDMKVNGELV